jgi:hypothetical protein
VRIMKIIIESTLKATKEIAVIHRKLGIIIRPRMKNRYSHYSS